jgi:aurora kinase
VLGQGGCGVVFKARDKITDTIVAVKMIPITSRATRDSNGMTAYEREVNIHSSLDHPGIVKMHGAFRAPYNSAAWLTPTDWRISPTTTCLFIVMEFLLGGSLYELNSKSTFSEAAILSIGNQLRSALLYIHGKGVMHRDIKLENILVASVDTAGIPQVKITDFGLSTDEAHPKDEVGTIYYRPPEMLWGSPYTQKVDLWSLGVLIFELASGGINPFSPKDEDSLDEDEFHDEIRRNIRCSTPDFDLIGSVKIRGITKILLDRSPNARTLSKKERTETTATKAELSA